MLPGGTFRRQASEILNQTPPFPSLPLPSPPQSQKSTFDSYTNQSFITNNITDSFNLFLRLIIPCKFKRSQDFSKHSFDVYLLIMQCAHFKAKSCSPWKPWSWKKNDISPRASALLPLKWQSSYKDDNLGGLKHSSHGDFLEERCGVGKFVWSCYLLHQTSGPSQSILSILVVLRFVVQYPQFEITLALGPKWYRYLLSTPADHCRFIS